MSLNTACQLEIKVVKLMIYIIKFHIKVLNGHIFSKAISRKFRVVPAINRQDFIINCVSLHGDKSEISVRILPLEIVLGKLLVKMLSMIVDESPNSLVGWTSCGSNP